MKSSKKALTFEEERRTGIGGSDLGSLFNLKPYGCRRRLWYEKRGTAPDYPREVSAAMERGIALEDHAAKMYAEKTGRRIRRARFRRHREHPWLMVHLDRTILSADDRGPGALEIKTAGQWAFTKILREGIPSTYQLQVQHSLLVSGRKWGAIAVLWPDGYQLVEMDLERDDAIHAEIVEAAAAFWALVENGPGPERLTATDKRCSRCAFRTTCQGEALRILIKSDEPATARPDLDDLAARFLVARELEAEAAENLAELKAELKAALEDETAAEIAGHRFLHRGYFRALDTRALERANPELFKKYQRAFDSEAFRKDFPELYEAYKTDGWTRPLRVFPI